LGTRSAGVAVVCGGGYEAKDLVMAAVAVSTAVAVSATMTVVTAVAIIAMTVVATAIIAATPVTVIPRIIARAIVAVVGGRISVTRIGVIRIASAVIVSRAHPDSHTDMHSGISLAGDAQHSQ